jgi:hypothetical protein
VAISLPIVEALGAQIETGIIRTHFGPTGPSRRECPSRAHPGPLSLGHGDDDEVLVLLGDAEFAAMSHVGPPCESAAEGGSALRVADVTPDLAGLESPPAAALALVLRDLHAYAEGRVDTPAGAEALRSHGFAHPDARRAYRPGFLPAGYRSLLPPAMRCAFARLPGNSVLLPAWDEAGAVVDVAAVRLSDGYLVPTLGAAPRGLLAPVLATAFDKLVVTDAVARIRDGWSSAAPTLLLRGVADAQANAARLAAGGVRVVEVRVRRHAAAMVAALRAAGIEVREASTVDPAPVVVAGSEVAAEPTPVTAVTPIDLNDVTTSTDLSAAPTLTLVRHDAHAEQATFRWGALTLIVQVPWGTSTTLDVVVEAGGQRHRDRLDLAQDPQRQRFAQVAAIRLRVPVPDLVAALAPLLPAVQALARPVPAVAAPRTAADAMTEADRAEALALLRDEHLLERLTADLDTVGWTGDADAKALTLLSAISRLSPDPVWIALTATDPAERFPGLAVLAAITPPEHLLHASRLTDHALVNTDPDALRHKLLLIDDAQAITAPVATALKVLRAQGGLTGTTVERDHLGQMRTRFVLAPGPVAVVTAAAGDLPPALRHHLVEVPMEEGPAQEERRRAEHRQRLASTPSRVAGVVERLRNLQRLLEPLPVLIPDRVERPAVPRVLADAHLGLIAASALLHQHQRPQVDGAVAASTADVTCATRLVAALTRSTTPVTNGLGRTARLLLDAMTTAGQPDYTMADLAALLRGWCRWSLRHALDALVRVELVTVERRGRGGTHHYRRVASAGSPNLAGWRELGGSPPASLCPEVACG